MAQITSREELEEWLKDKPVEFAQVIAARAAMRALPYAFGKRESDDWIARYSLALFRATAISWAARSFPDHAAYAAAHAAADAARAAVVANPFAMPSRAALNAARSAETADATVRCVRAADTSDLAARDASAVLGIDVDYAAEAARDAIWINISHDCAWLASEGDSAAAAHGLTQRPLWPAGEPDGWGKAHAFADARLAGLKQGYGVWTEWYDRRVRGNEGAFDIPGDKGRLEDKAILMKLADATDEDFWDKGAIYVNLTLQGWIDEARARVAAADPASGDEIDTTEIPKTETSERIDFFISYATKEESMAREVEAILSERGYTSIAQFKDFAQTNFVSAMLNGIADADRFIALQSIAYWESDHCRSEWSAAYARDPGAKQRKIVPFLLEPMQLPPIASEIVYQRLFDLTEAERKQAILESIEYRPPSRSTPELRKKLAAQASPDARIVDDRLDAGPNATFDKPRYDGDLATLPSQLRTTLGILSALARNASPTVRLCVEAYDNELLLRGTQPILGTLKNMASAIAAQIWIAPDDANKDNPDAWVLKDPREWEAGAADLFRSFFKAHLDLITHFPLDPQREAMFAATPIDEVAASDKALTDPIDKVTDLIVALAKDGHATDNIARIVEGLSEYTRVIAGMPKPDEKELPSTTITPKRRHILQTAGFYLHAYSILGTTAQLSTLPQVQALMTALADAAERLMAFIL
jgi:TIR domain